MPKKRITDGLNKHQRYRLKDVEGYREKKREYAKTEDQKIKRRDYMRLWRDRNRERHNELARISHKKNKYKHIDKLRYSRFEKLYGVTRERYILMQDEQGGKCLICQEKPKTERLFHIDHDHKTKIVRGLLCSRCNGALGWYEKYSTQIQRYLNR